MKLNKKDPINALQAMSILCGSGYILSEELEAHLIKCSDEEFLLCANEHTMASVDRLRSSVLDQALVSGMIILDLNKKPKRRKKKRINES